MSVMSVRLIKSIGNGNKKYFKGDKEMKKEDLKTGMVVKTKDGLMYEVLLGMNVRVGKDILRGISGWLDLEDYNDDLYIMDSDKRFDIVEIYEPKYYSSRLEHFPDRYELLWKREQEKFYLKHNWLKGYLNYNKDNDSYLLSRNDELRNYKTKFTLDELEKIERELDTTLNDFTLEPVRDY